MLICLTLPTAAAAKVETSEANQPGVFEQYKNDVVSFYKNIVSYDWPVYALQAGTTLALLPYDQKIVDSTISFSKKNRLSNDLQEDRQITKFKILSSEQELRAPRSAIGFAWYLGDGMFSTSLALGLAGYGYFGSDYHGIEVAKQIIESLLIAGPNVLLIKLATGREAPSRATKSGGVWRGYPGITNYAKDQSRYYAYPSGHVATAVSTLTVVAKNYTDETWIWPVGNILVGSLMYSLMKVGSHWPSDFPLAVLIGYTSGSSVAAGRHKPSGAANNLMPRLNGQIKLANCGIKPTFLGLAGSLSTTCNF